MWFPATSPENTAMAPPTSSAPPPQSAGTALYTAARLPACAAQQQMVFKGGEGLQTEAQ
jgi:hypothetical protein